MRPEGVIRLLADGEWHSGEALAKAANVSRAAIWKQLQGLDEYGLALEAHRGRGYKLAAPFMPLVSTDILEAMPEQRDSFAKLQCVWTAQSTNDQVKTLSALASVDQPFVAVLAEHQSAGRGRRGKAWVAPLGGSVLLSLLWRLEGMPSNPAAAALVAGLAVAQTINQFAGKPVAQLKWPNDVYVEGRKIAGVLCEIQGDPSSQCDLVVGVGLNFNLAAEAENIDQPTADCQQLGVSPAQRPQLIAVMLSKLADYLLRYRQQGFLGFASEWAEFDWLKGRSVQVLLGDAVEYGIAKSVESDGALLVDHDGVLKRHIAGEVSVRKA